MPQTYKFEELQLEVQERLVRELTAQLQNQGTCSITHLDGSVSESKISFVSSSYARSLLESADTRYLETGERLYKFSELSCDVQRQLAETLVRATQDPPGETATAYACGCLMTEPEAKYTADGAEVG